jgi:hypothetical protein
MAKPSIKQIFSEFESYNHKSIQPLPKIREKQLEKSKLIWENKQTSPGRQLLNGEKYDKLKKLQKSEFKDERNSDEISENDFDIPNPSGQQKQAHQFYVNQQIPSDKGYLAEPLFELTARDALSAQSSVHTKIVKNEMINFTGSDSTSPKKKYDQANLKKVQGLIQSEIALFHNNNHLLNKIYKGYANYIDYLFSLDTPDEPKVDDMHIQLTQAAENLRIKEDEAIETMEHIEELKKLEPPPPIIKEVETHINPLYSSQTQHYIQLTNEIQHFIEQSENLSSDLKKMGSWNPKLEENLILEEAEMISKIKKAENQISQVRKEHSAEMINRVRNLSQF